MRVLSVLSVALAAFALTATSDVGVAPVSASRHHSRHITSARSLESKLTSILECPHLPQFLAEHAELARAADAIFHEAVKASEEAEEEEGEGEGEEYDGEDGEGEGADADEADAAVAEPNFFKEIEAALRAGVHPFPAGSTPESIANSMIAASKSVLTKFHVDLAELKSGLVAKFGGAARAMPRAAAALKRSATVKKLSGKHKPATATRTHKPKAESADADSAEFSEGAPTTIPELTGDFSDPTQPDPTTPTAPKGNFFQRAAKTAETGAVNVVGAAIAIPIGIVAAPIAIPAMWLFACSVGNDDGSKPAFCP